MLAAVSTLAVSTLGHTLRVVDAEGNDVAIVGDVTLGNRALVALFAAAPDMKAALVPLVRGLSMFIEVGALSPLQAEVWNREVAPAVEDAMAALAKSGAR